MKQFNIPVIQSVSDKVIVEAESLESKPLQFLVRFVLKKKELGVQLGSSKPFAMEQKKAVCRWQDCIRP